MTAVAAVPRRPKMTIENQMRASQWLFKNTAILASMTLEEIAGAINGQAQVTSTIPLSSIKRLMEAANLAWKPKTKAEERVGKQAIYDKLLAVIGRVEKQDEIIHAQQAAIESLLRRVDSMIANTKWLSQDTE